MGRDGPAFFCLTCLFPHSACILTFALHRQVRLSGLGRGAKANVKTRQERTRKQQDKPKKKERKKKEKERRKKKEERRQDDTFEDSRRHPSYRTRAASFFLLSLSLFPSHYRQV
jgi:hypothetical protein